MTYIKTLLFSLMFLACGTPNSNSKLSGDFRTNHIEESFHLFESNFIYKMLETQALLCTKAAKSKFNEKSAFLENLCHKRVFKYRSSVFSSLVFIESAYTDKLSYRSCRFNPVYFYSNCGIK